MAGLKLLRPGSGLVQLSSVDICYQLASIGSAILLDSGTAQPQPIVVGEVTVSGTNPILAFRASEGVPVTVRSVSTSGSNVTYRFQATSSNPVGIIYWCFDVASNSSPQFTGPRMRTWTQQGVKTFDSYAYAMRLSTSGSGSNVAVVQSMYANRWTFTNLGNTGDGQWIIQSTRSQSAARFNANGTIDTGLIPYATTTVRTNPANGMPNNEEWGDSAHTFIDIQGLPSASMPSQTSLNVSASASLRAVSVDGGVAVHSVTPAVTVSVTGGNGAYSYTWQKVSGSTEIVSYGPENTANFQTQAYINPGTVDAVWRCRVQDTAGRVGYSPEVTFRHTVTWVDREPNTITMAALSLVTNDYQGWTNTGQFTVSGISEAIVLRFTRGNQVDSGGIFTRRLYIFHTTNNGASWTEYTIGAGANGTADITVNAGDQIHIRAFCDTTSGRGDTSFTGYITNLTTGTALAQFNVTGTVDLDNNYNNFVPDVVADWINLPVISGVVNENDYSWSTTSYGTHQVLGINQPVTLRFERYNYSGNLDALYIDVFTAPPGQEFQHHGYFAAHVNDGQYHYLDVPNVVNGTRVAFNPHAISNSGRRSGQCDLVIHNNTSGHTIARANGNSFTVDNDNNWNVAPIYTPNPVDWGNTSLTSPDSTVWADTNTVTITGINQPITLRGTVSNSTGTGAGELEVWVNGAWRGGSTNLNNGSWTAATVNNGDQVMWRGYIQGSGYRYRNFNVTVSNQTTGGQTLDTFNIGLSVGDNA